MSEAKYAAHMLATQEAIAAALRRRIEQAHKHEGWSSSDMKAAAIGDYTNRLSKAEAFAEHWRRTLAVLLGVEP